MERQITNYQGKRVLVELASGTQLMGTVHWIQDDGGTFGLSDGKAEHADVIATRYVALLRLV